jgi:transposase InsO family protein
MDERVRFVARVDAGESITDLCREFNVSRKTGHKILKRYREGGLDGLKDQRRAPKRIPHKTAPELLALIVDAKKAHPTWGPKKLKAWLGARNEGVVLPSVSTMASWLQREGLVRPYRRRRRVPRLARVELTRATAPNEVWCADFKGQFQLGDGRLCYPLTITDLHSRFLIACTALESTRVITARWAFEEAFREYGLPRVIRTDNGIPFASTGLAGLTSLSALWVRLGIRPERIEPAHPEQNGQHERMHLTLKQDTTRPAAANMLAQQERFDRFRTEFNRERPHEALGQLPPGRFYKPSDRRYPDTLAPLSYPLHDRSYLVRSKGMLRMRSQVLYLSAALAGERIGLREVDVGRWIVSYATLDLGEYDERTNTFEPAELLPLCPVSTPETARVIEA